MNRLLRWFLAFFDWERKVARDPIDEVVAALREKHRRKVEGFNHALAAATNLRGLLRGQIDELGAQEVRLQSRLQAAADSGDDAAGAAIALEVQRIAAEREELARRRGEADQDAAELEQLRDQAIAFATAELEEASALASKARYPAARIPPGLD